MSRATAVTSRGGAGGRLEVQRVALLELAGCCDGYPAAVALLGSASRRDGDPAAAALLGSAGRCDGDSAVAALLVSAGRRDGDSAAAARLLAFLSQFGDPAVPQMSDKSQYFMIPVSSTLKLDLATLSTPLVRYGAEAAVRSHHLLSRYGAEAADACSPLLGRYGAEAYAISSPLLGRDAVIFHPLGRYGAEATYACSSPVLGLYASEADATASSLLGRNASKADATTSPLLDRHGANARFPLLGIGSRPATTATVAGVRGTATGALIRGNPCGFTVAGLAGSRSRFPLLGVGSVPATTVAGLAGSNLLPTRRYMSIFARKKIRSDSVGDLENDPMARMASIMQQVVRDQMKIERRRSFPWVLVTSILAIKMGVFCIFMYLKWKLLSAIKTPEGLQHAKQMVLFLVDLMSDDMKILYNEYVVDANILTQMGLKRAPLSREYLEEQRKREEKEKEEREEKERKERESAGLSKLELLEENQNLRTIAFLVMFAILFFKLD